MSNRSAGHPTVVAASSPQPSADTQTQAKADGLVAEMHRQYAARRWGGVLRAAEALRGVAPERVPAATVDAANSEIIKVELDLRYREAQRQLAEGNTSAAVGRLQAVVSVDHDYRDASILLERARAETLAERAGSAGGVSESSPAGSREGQASALPVTTEQSSPPRRRVVRRPAVPAAAIGLVVGIVIGVLVVPHRAPVGSAPTAAPSSALTRPWTTTDRAGGTGPAADLLARIPASLQPDCSVTGDDLRGAAAEVVCLPRGHSSTVRAVNYWIFGSRGDFAAAAPDWSGAVAARSDCASRAGHAPYSTVADSGRNATGLLSCMDLGTTVALDWTDDHLLVTATALGAGGTSIGQLRAWWLDNLLR